MIKMTLDLTDETTWAQLKRWVEAVDATGEVAPDTKIVRDGHDHNEAPRDRLEIELN